MYGWSGFGDTLTTSSGIEKSLILIRCGISFPRLLHVGFILIRVVKVAVQETHSNTINPRLAVLVVLEVIVPSLVARVAGRTVLLIGLLNSATGGLPVLEDVV
jgi:hypothetical protein